MVNERLEYQFTKDSFLSARYFRVRWYIQRDNNTARALCYNTSGLSKEIVNYMSVRRIVLRCISLRSARVLTKRTKSIWLFLRCVIFFLFAMKIYIISRSIEIINRSDIFANFRDRIFRVFEITANIFVLHKTLYLFIYIIACTYYSLLFALL